MLDRREVSIDVLGAAKKQERQISVESFLEPILNKPLTVERIDNYADDAVNELIFLLNQKVDDYKSTHNTGSWDDQSIENATLRFYGLESVSSYLDFLAEKDAEIRSLNGVIKKASQIGEVIVKPDSYDPPTGNGNGEMKEKKVISRVKTVLFILKEDFEVDVNDENQLTLKKGILKDNMIRKTSYFLISVPKIDRTLLVCDEEWNVSYVFNSNFLKDEGITEQILISSTKEKLNELIQQTPELGKRLIYSKDGFVPRMIKAIENPDSKKPDEVVKEMGGIGKYLYTKAEENELSCKKLAERLMIDPNSLSKLINQIGSEELGGVKLKRFGSQTTQAYTPDQQALIIKKAEAQGLLTPKAEENELSCNKLAKKLMIDHDSLNKFIRQLDPEELGGVKLKRFGSQTTQAYTPDQQALIIKKAEAQGLLTPKAEENELSCNKLAERLMIDPNSLSKLINQIGSEELGEVKLRKFDSAITKAYTPEQQALIIKKAEAQGLLTPKAEENELSCNKLAKKLMIDYTTLSKLIRQMDPEELGEVKLRKHNTKHAQAYTLEQQWKIIEYIREHRKGLIKEEKWKELDEEKRKWMESKTEE